MNKKVLALMLVFFFVLVSVITFITTDVLELESTNLHFSSAPRDSNYLYQSASKDYKAYLGDRQSKEAKVRFEQEDAWAEFSPTFSSFTQSSSSDDNSVKFVSEEGVELRYQPIEKGLKEEIVIDQHLSAVNSASFGGFSFALTLYKAIPKKSVDGALLPVFIDPQTEEYRFHFQKPFMIDSAGSRSEAVTLKIIPQVQALSESLNSSSLDLLSFTAPSGAPYLVKLEPSLKWLNDPARVYPVIIDPTVVHDTQTEFSSGSFNRVKDVGVGETAPELVTYYHELPADEHTVGLWHMNETANDTCSGGQDACDSSGNGNHGTATGTTITTTSQKLGAAARSFNGTSDYINIPDASSLNPGTGNFTWEAWFKTSTSDPTGFDDIIAKHLTGTQPLIAKYQDKLTWYNGAVIAQSPQTIHDGQWHHGAVSRSSNIITLYLDGTAVATGTDSNNISNTNPIRIGAQGSGATIENYFPGSIDDVRISNRALTPEEIKLNAQRRPYGVYTSNVVDLGADVSSIDSLQWTENGVQTGDGETLYSSTNLVAQWNLNETSGTSAADASGNGNTGTLTGFSDTSGQDVVAGSGWTANNRRWGAGALMFDGSNDYVADTSLSSSLTGDMTVEAWIKPSSSPTYADRILDVAQSSAIGLNIAYYTNGSLFVDNAGGPTSSIIATGDYRGMWTHIAATRSGTTYTFYVNGVSFGTSGGTAPTYTKFYLGCYSTPGLYGDVIIDSARIYSRALGADEILANYQAGQIEFQTRTGADSTPDDGSWEAWKPTTSESQILSMDSDAANWGACAPGQTDNGNGTCTATYQVGASGDDGWAYYEGSSYNNVESDLDIGSVSSYAREPSFRFTNVAVLQGATISSATLTITAYSSLSYGVYTKLRAEHANNPGQVTSFADFTGRTLTSTGVDWDPGAFTANVEYTSPNIATVVSDVIEESWWDSGDALHIVWKNDGTTGTNYRKAYSYRGNAAKAAKLSITYKPLGASAMIKKTNDSTTYIEGTGSMKVVQGAPQVDANTVGLWHMEETSGTAAYIKDSTANANHGTPTGTTVVDGFFGKARSFNGTSDYISVSDNSVFDLQSFTLETWIKTSGAGSTRRRIISQQDTNYWVLSLYDNYLEICFSYDSELNDSGLGYPCSRYTGQALNDNNWHHVAGVRSSGNSVKFYIDGSNVKTVNISGTSTSSIAANVFMGAHNDGSEKITGIIDSVRISNTARTAEEIAEAYRAGRDHRLSRTITSTDLSSKTKLPFYVAADRPGTYLEATIGESAYANYEPDSNTVGLWHLEEQTGSGAYIKDSSSSGNNGTPTGTTFVQGKIGKARSFNGTSDYISVADSTSTNFGAGSFTISAWVKTNAVPGAGKYPAIATKRTPTDTKGWEVFGSPGVTTLAVEMATTNGGPYYYTPSVTPALATWAHIVFVIDRTSGLGRAFLDGVEQGTATDISGMTGTLDNSTPLKIGVHYAGVAFFNGLIDEVRISNTTRTADQIRQAYEIGKRTHPITIDFSAKMNAVDIAGTSEANALTDTTFTVDATAYGAGNKGDGVYKGDKVIVRENYGGTEYIATGTVTAITASTGVVTVAPLTGTVPNPGTGVCGGANTHCYTANATVFKWQREWFDTSASLSAHRDAATRLTLRVTDGSEGRTFWLDDFESGGAYLTTAGGSTVSSTVQRYFQYRAIFSTTDTAVSSELSSVTVSYTSGPTPTPSPTVPPVFRFEGVKMEGIRID